MSTESDWIPRLLFYAPNEQYIRTQTKQKLKILGDILVAQDAKNISAETQCT